jgi:hypothetical protein
VCHIHLGCRVVWVHVQQQQRLRRWRAKPSRRNKRAQLRPPQSWAMAQVRFSAQSALRVVTYSLHVVCVWRTMGVSSRGCSHGGAGQVHGRRGSR